MGSWIYVYSSRSRHTFKIEFRKIVRGDKVAHIRNDKFMFVLISLSEKKHAWY